MALETQAYPSLDLPYVSDGNSGVDFLRPSQFQMLTTFRAPNCSISHRWLEHLTPFCTVRCNCDHMRSVTAWGRPKLSARSYRPGYCARCKTWHTPGDDQHMSLSSTTTARCIAPGARLLKGHGVLVTFSAAGYGRSNTRMPSMTRDGQAWHAGGDGLAGIAKDGHTALRYSARIRGCISDTSVRLRRKNAYYIVAVTLCNGSASVHQRSCMGMIHSLHTRAYPGIVSHVW
jgi:hypothetical protein